MSTHIRWTDDEWLEIARHLCAKQGADSIRALNLQKIKAKDVFLAQQMLPEGRHRKLLSIAQGFSGIRARLGALTQKLTDGEQVTACADKVEMSLEEEAASNTGAPVSTAAVQDMTVGDGSTESDGRTAGQSSARNVIAEKQGSKSVRQASSCRDRAQERTYTPGLLETTRPFIVMVCEEFAKAIVKVISTQGMKVTLPDASGQTRSRVVASREEALHGPVVEGVQSNLSNGKIDREHCLADETNVESVDLGFVPQEEQEEDSLDVQPLFDPKLPPSADSDFKPNIGLVGTPGSDFDGLRQYYPQLHLTIVQADALSDIRRFGHCQRIIVLREEISAGTDALLSRLLRHRYIRLDGGMNGVKAQLDAWLASPGSIAAGSRRRMPFDGTKGNAASKMKHQNRYPKWVGDAG